MVRLRPNQRWSLVILALILGSQLYCIGHAQTQSPLQSPLQSRLQPNGSTGSIGSASLIGDSTDTRSDQDISPRWPYVFDESGFHFYSLVPPKVLEPQIQGILRLPDELNQELGITLKGLNVHILVFDSRRSLDEYLHRYYPGLRAANSMYIRDQGPGLILTWFHADWLVDVRHEATHALLHAKRVSIPLWIDEGLAEYFEYPSGSSSGESFAIKSHPVHTKLIHTQLRFGQFANLEEQERWDPNKRLSNQQYRDAWGSVAFLLNHSDQSKDEFRSYVKDLLENRASGNLSYRLQQTIPDWRTAYTRYYREHSVASSIR
jgi:hypothetical protein